MAKKTQPPLTPEQRQRQREGLRRWQAARTPEEKEATRLNYVKKLQTWRQRGNLLPGRLTASRWSLDDEVDDVS